MNTLTHDERYAAVKAGSSYLLPETIHRNWDTYTIQYSSYEELLTRMKPTCDSSSRKTVLHFLAAKRLMEQVFETLVAEYGAELGDLGGIMVFSQDVVLFSAEHCQPEWPRILVLNLDTIAQTAKQYHRDMDWKPFWIVGALCLGIAAVVLLKRGL
jgi:hypothetical protein